MEALPEVVNFCSKLPVLISQIHKCSEQPMAKRLREGGREGRREGGRERGKEGGREGGRREGDELHKIFCGG